VNQHLHLYHNKNPRKTFGLLLNIMESPSWVEVHLCDLVIFRPTMQE
jgi:hypothetical protein